MERIAMSQEERDELDWLKRAKEGNITQREAARKMGVSDRWVRTLLKRMSKQGDAVVVHGLRGRPSNRKVPAETQRQALTMCDFARSKVIFLHTRPAANPLDGKEVVHEVISKRAVRPDR